ncbi:MAG: hypothetical protein H8E37_08240 [Planctomycetes bacterium]|nr:hypothetical protein [Planctomycetota bacterium]
MITVQCPHCEKLVSRPADSVGHYGDCPECGELFVALTVISGDVLSADTAASGDTVPGSSRTKPREGGAAEIHLPGIVAGSVGDSSRGDDGDLQIEFAEPPTSEVIEPLNPDESDPQLDSDFELGPDEESASDFEESFSIENSEPSDEDEKEEYNQDSVKSRLVRQARELVASKQSKAVLVSSVMHLVLLLIFAAWILPQLPASDMTTLLTMAPDAQVEDLIETADLEIVEPAAVPDAAPDLMQPHPPADSTVPEFEIKAPGPTPVPETSPDPGGSESAAPAASETTIRERAEKQISQASTVEAATDAIVASMRGRLKERDTVVVWLMDRSISMNQQRELLANRVSDFLHEVDKNESGEFHKLLHIVVAFGARAEKLIGTGSPIRALTAMRKEYAVDPSGLENVFSAVEWSTSEFVAKVSAHRGKHVMFVVSTDESGDDYLRMENAIAGCRKYGIEVSVIGPSAVLGQMQGHHAYTASDRRVYYLPVVRGPDTAFRQRLPLPYWFRGVPAHWDESRRGPWQGNTPTWQGGSNLDAILSGFGPYALTRLTLATGGDYIVYDRPRDRSPFRFDELRPYLPDYRSPNAIQADLYNHPLRLALLKMVNETQKLNLRLPRTDFGTQFGGSFYLTPPQFRAQLAGELKTEVRRALQGAAAIEKILNNLDSRAVRGEYDQETSPRWQAWRDLTVGRLRAGRVRCLAYAEFISKSNLSTLQPTTNGLSIRPRSLPRTSVLADEAASAKELLDRCRESHQGTPWQYLADRERAHAFGFSIRERAVPPARRTGVAPPIKSVTLPRL